MFSFGSRPITTAAPTVSADSVRELQEITENFIKTYHSLEFKPLAISFSKQSSIVCAIEDTYSKSTVWHTANRIEEIIAKKLDEKDKEALRALRKTACKPELLKIDMPQLQNSFGYFLDKYTPPAENLRVITALKALSNFTTNYDFTFTAKDLLKIQTNMQTVCDAVKYHLREGADQLEEHLNHFTKKRIHPTEPRFQTAANYDDLQTLLSTLPDLITQEKITNLTHCFQTTPLAEIHQALENTKRSDVMCLYFEYVIRFANNLKAGGNIPYHTQALIPGIDSIKSDITFIITHINALSNQTFVVEDYNRLIFGTCEKISAIENDRGAFIKEKYEQLLTAPLEPARYKLYLLKPFDLWFQANAASEQKPYTIDKNGTFLFYAAGTPANERPVDEQINWRPKPQSSASSSSSSS